MVWQTYGLGDEYGHWVDPNPAPPVNTWAADRGLAEVEKAVTAAMWGGVPLPDNIKQWLDRQSGGATPLDQWNSYVANRQDRESGGGGFLGIEELSTGNDWLDNALTYGQGAMLAGNVGGAALTGGDLGDALIADAAALAGASLAAPVAQMAGGGTPGAITGGAASGAAKSALTGGDVVEGALTGAVAPAIGAAGLDDMVGGGALGNIVEGVATGAGKSLITGGDPLSGALMGAVAPGVGALLPGGGDVQDAAEDAMDDASGGDEAIDDYVMDDDADMPADDFSYSDVLGDGSTDFADDPLLADVALPGVDAPAPDVGMAAPSAEGPVQGAADDLFDTGAVGDDAGSDVTSDEQAPIEGAGEEAMGDDDLSWLDDQTLFGEDYGAGNVEFGGGELSDQDFYNTEFDNLFDDEETLDGGEFSDEEWGQIFNGDTAGGGGILGALRGLGSGAVNTLRGALSGDPAAIRRLAQVGIPAAMIAGLFERNESPLTEPMKGAVQGALDHAAAYAATPTIGLTPSQLKAIEVANATSGDWRGDLERSGALADRAAAGVTDADRARYENPYLDKVLNPGIRDIEEAAARRREELKAVTSMSGNDLRTPSTDPNRFNIEDSLLDRETFRAIGDFSGKTRAAAFDTALGHAGKDLDRSLTASNVHQGAAKTRGALNTVDFANLSGAGALERLPQEDARTKSSTASTLYSRAAGTAASAIPATTPKSTLSQGVGALGALGSMRQLGIY
jgi:hypothetical protein